MTTTGVSVRADRTEGWSEIVAKLMTRVDSIDLNAFKAGEKLQSLLGHFTFDGVKLDPSSAVRTGERFIIPGALYVEMNFADGGPAFAIRDSYPINLEFRLKGDATSRDVVIKQIDVDTRSLRA